MLGVAVVTVTAECANAVGTVGMGSTLILTALVYILVALAALKAWRTLLTAQPWQTLGLGTSTVT